MLLACALLLTPGLRAQSDEQRAAQTRERIAALEAEITAITQRQKRQRQARDELQNQLESVETQRASLSRQRRDTRASINATRADILDLEAQRETTSAAARAQEQAIGDELRASYRDGNDNQLKLLLGQENPQDLARMLAIYRRILGARSALIDEYRATAEKLVAVEKSLNEQEASLQNDLAALDSQDRELAKTRKERAELLTKVEEKLANDEQALAARANDRAQLEDILEEIEAALAQLFPEDTVEPFSEARGSMPWPIDGRITQRFGRPRNQGKMRWQGVRMTAETGATVGAIHHGRVVFADWLRGSGLLMVIDHGEGYMSLYAHNETLLREVGDWVTTGAPVATVGDSGGQQEAGLYFEIRKDGKPTDPQPWFQG
ncbi:MAG: peptidoglycan DD-metalloendopeptidase family protein [Pseudomonadota bacterium]